MKEKTMEFLNKMKKREFIEMGLKTAIAVLIGVIVIFLMEAMIFNIRIKAVENHTGQTMYTKIVTCYELADERNDDGEIIKGEIYLDTTNGWKHFDINSEKDFETYLGNHEDDGFKTIKGRKPNAFELSINGVHYVVMVLFLLLIGGVFTWRFTLISKEYKKLERKFKKTGKIFS